jgi:lysophospholipase L1-like esterase
MMEPFYRRIARKAADFSQPPVLIAAFGDSITQGVMEYGRIAPELVYHRLLQLRLQETFPLTTFSTLNAGVSGTTAPQALARLQRDVISHHPDLVLVAFGANDCLEGKAGEQDFRTALTTIVQRVRSETEADVVLLTPPMLADRKTDLIHPGHEAMVDPILRAQTGGQVASYAAIVRAVAAQERVALADIQQAWRELAATGVDVVTWLSNGLNHPDERGQRMAAEVLWSRLEAARK